LPPLETRELASTVRTAFNGGRTRNVIATTKLAIPSPRRALVPRPDLSARLDEPGYRLAMVAAPAGYGKTATLASWASTQPHDLAWLSCDSADAEPSRFMSGLLAAISVQWPGVADDASVILERDGSRTHDAAIAVANELASIDVPGVIVVDDLHLAKPAPVTLSTFVDALPEHFRLVFGSRSDLPMSLARFRVHGGLLELRSDDLRFTAAQTAEFSRLHDLSLEPSELQRLHELTEGWPAGAQLAALSLQRSDDRRQFLDAFARTDRAVGDFLLSEVLDHLEPELVDFLIDTSVLESFDADLCAKVSGRDNAAILLDRLIATDLFVVPLDDEGRLNRYHHLFGAFLRARLASLGEGRRLAVHERAGRALEARGDVTGALQQAMAVDDLARVGQVLRTTLARNMSMSDADVARSAIRIWLHEFGSQFVETNPNEVAEFVIGLISISGSDDAMWWLDKLQRANPNPDRELQALIHGAWAELHLYNGESENALRRSQAGLDAVDGRPPNKGLIPLIFSAVVRAHIHSGDLDQARVALEKATAYTSGNALSDEVRQPGLASLMAALDGDLGRALQLAADVERRADGMRLGIHEPGRIWAGMARVETHLERNEFDQATAILESVREAADASHRAPYQSLVALQGARLARAMGDPPAAEALLLQAGLLLPNPDEATRSVFAVETVQQALRFDPDKASGLIDALDQERPETQVLRARQLLIEGDHRAAAAVLDALPPAATTRLRVERDVLRALSFLQVDVDRANERLRDALAAARPERLIRSIIDPGPDAFKLLMSSTPDARTQSFVEELIDASSHTVAPRRSDVKPALVEQLSAREMTVLRYLSSRLTYEEIAAALYVSLNTLKTHVKAVYRKLEVASRSEAVSIGRSLRLI
jgi:LuxR family transcriptional regulator, maltose regulon positive regulatory protein